jgi:hypothetical protein
MVSSRSTIPSATETTTSYCYDRGDRLLGTTITPAAAADANPVAAGLAGSELGYDVRGNTSVLADQELGYDATDQRTTTTLTDGTVKRPRLLAASMRVAALG